MTTLRSPGAQQSQLTGAQVALEIMKSEGVDVVFGYPGGAILPMYDALHGSDLRHILCRHEQGAALAANGYARATGQVGVCIATSGPGVTNLVTGLADALLDSVPMVALTGQVSTAVLGTDAFQEVDTLGLTMPVVKHGFLVERVADIPHVLREAFRVARSGRPGPVVVDLPKDVQAASLRWRPSPVVQLSVHKVPNSMPIPRARLGAAVQLIRRAKRPLVYAGGGVGMAGAVELFRRFVRQTQTPTVTTLKAIGLMPPDEPLGMGMLGMHGLEHANKAVQRCDLLIALGARFDDRVTGKLEGFAPHARVLHIDIDAAELGKVRAADVGICADLKPALRQLNDQLTEPLAVDAWRRECAELKAEHAWDYEPPFDAIYAPRLLRDLSAAQGATGVLTCDVGQHQMWVAQHCGVHHPTNHLSSGGLGTMGFGLPAAIGAQLGRPAASVINVTGDGSIMMNLQELATIGRYRLPVKIVLLDNSGLGMVRQWQQLFLGERYSETDLSDNPDFVQVARAFGFTAFAIERRAEEALAIETLLQTPGPVLAHVRLDPRANVWPIVPPGADNSTMWKEPRDERAA